MKTWGQVSWPTASIAADGGTRHFTKFLARTRTIALGFWNGLPGNDLPTTDYRSSEGGWSAIAFRGSFGLIGLAFTLLLVLLFRD